MAHVAKLAEALIAVARTGSLTGAARMLGVSQPTLSRHLDELERRVGHLLVERTASGTRLTQRGQALLPVAERAADGVDRFSHYIREATRRSDTIRVGLAEPAVPELVDPLLEEHQSAFPTTAIEVLTISRHDAPAALQLGDVDVVVGSRCTGPRFTVVSWADEDYVALAGPAVRARHPRRLPPSDVARERIVVPAWIDDAEVATWTVGRRGPPLRVAGRFDDLNRLWYEVVFKASVCIVPRGFARRHLHPRTKMLPLSIGATSTLEVARLRRSTRPAKEFMSVATPP